MDYNTQFQAPQPEPTGSSRGKMIGLLILGILLILACGYVIWSMNYEPEQDVPNTPTEQTADDMNSESQDSQVASDEVSAMDQEASAFDSTELDTNLQGNIESELSN